MRLLCSCAFEIRVRKKSSGRSWTWFGVASQMVCPSVWPEIQSRSASEWISYEMAGSRRTQPRLPQRPSWIGLVLNGFQPEIARPWLQTVEPKITCQSANALFLAGIRIAIAFRSAWDWAKGDSIHSQNGTPAVEVGSGAFETPCTDRPEWQGAWFRLVFVQRVLRA